MQKTLIYLYKLQKHLLLLLFSRFWSLYARFLFYLNGVKHGDCLHALGSFRVNVALSGKFTIGDNFHFRSYSKYSDTGDNRPCKFLVGKNSNLNIGNNVAITAVTIVCHNYIIIGDNVKIGGGTTIFDTNFHSTDSSVRKSESDLKLAIFSPIVIEEDVFIGTSCIICKGVIIGARSIVAAGSIVTRSIPRDQVWGGNPAKFIKEV
ncbi:acyltransferase [Spirosoma lituiforme]